MMMITILMDQESSLFVVLVEHMPLVRAGICCCLLVLEVGEALVEVVLGMPRLGVLFALGLRGGADESLHADLALRGRNFHDDQLTTRVSEISQEVIYGTSDKLQLNTLHSR
jgi:hypothetical protein